MIASVIRASSKMRRKLSSVNSPHWIVAAPERRERDDDEGADRQRVASRPYDDECRRLPASTAAAGRGTPCRRG